MEKALKSPENTRSRDPQRTKNQIMQAAVETFAAHGYHGAKIGDIAGAAECNARLIYHYYGNKEKLYLAALEHIYAKIREQEQQLKLDQRDPLAAIQTLVEFTFDFFDSNTTFVKITRNENLLGGVSFPRRPQFKRCRALCCPKSKGCWSAATPRARSPTGSTRFSFT